MILDPDVLWAQRIDATADRCAARKRKREEDARRREEKREPGGERETESKE